MRDSALPVRTRRQPFSGSSNSARWGSPVRARHAPSAEPLLHAGVSSSQRETRRGPCPQNVRSRPARRARGGHLTARRRRADSCMLLPLLPDDQAAPRAARSISRLRRLLLSRRGRRDGRVGPRACGSHARFASGRQRPISRLQAFRAGCVFASSAPRCPSTTPPAPRPRPDTCGERRPPLGYASWE
jgi:hypothetical protein